MKPARALLLIAAVTLRVAAQDPESSKKYLDQGIEAFRAARFPEAVSFFERAVQFEPNSSGAHLYLANTYLSEYNPGVETPENIQLADKARQEFQVVLRLDPTNETAVASIASLYMNQKNLGKAAEWYKRLAALNPQNKDAYLSLGAVAWTQWLVPDREARTKLGMKAYDPGPLRSDAVRQELRTKYLPILDDGIRNLEKALTIDKDFDDAMAYMNLLIRYRADLLDTSEEYEQQVQLADEWVLRALDTKRKKTKAEQAPQN